MKQKRTKTPKQQRNQTTKQKQKTQQKEQQPPLATQLVVKHNMNNTARARIVNPQAKENNNGSIKNTK